MSDVAMELSERLAAVVEEAGRSVVRVEGRRGAPASGVAAGADGVIVTANHTLERDDEIGIGLPDGRFATAVLLGRDPTTDVAALRVEEASLSQARWEEDPVLKAGHLLLAVSRPGRSARASLGVVNAFGEGWRTPAGGRIDRYIQSDIALQAGFSGSLLVDVSGRALGMNTSSLLRGGSLAVPAATVHRVVRQLVAHGGIRRGFFGVGVYPVRLPLDARERADSSVALLVHSVQPGGPAEKAGVLLGDAICSIDGHPTGGPSDLVAVLEEDRIGTEAAVRILRAGEIVDLRIVIGARGEGDSQRP
jgi:S1-C subfamily serine protease